MKFGGVVDRKEACKVPLSWAKLTLFYRAA